MNTLDLQQIINEKNSNFEQTFSNNEKIVIYGCGAQAQELVENCPKIEQILCLCDKKNFGTEFMGYPFYTIEELMKCQENFKIVISSFKYYDEIKEELIGKFGEEKILPYVNWQTRVHYNYDSKHYRKWLLDNSNNLNYINDLLADDKSKKAFRHILSGLENVTASSFMDITLISQQNLVNYFDNGIFQLTDHENFVDVGAYDGDTVLEFMKITNGKFDKIWAFEPDEELFSKLEKVAVSLQDKRLLCRREGVGREPGELSFCQNDNKYLSKPGKEGDGRIRITSIDKMIDNITFAKICIRGLDNILNVLEGAKECCAARKPKLAVVTELTDEGIIEIPKKIQKLNLDYKVYFRLTVYPQANGQKISACFFAV